MRRIIERVVTVVTTTTWKISWEAEPSQTEAPFSNDLSSLDILSGTVDDPRPGPAVIETKEVEAAQRENHQPRRGRTTA